MHGQPIIKMEYLSQFNRLRSKGYYNLSPGLITKILLSAHTVFLCVLCGSEKKTAIIPHTKLTFCFCITEAESVYCAVRTGCSTIMQASFRFQSLDKALRSLTLQ